MIVTGDLTNLAFPAEFETVRQILVDLGLPVEAITVVPGNHDYYTERSAEEDHFCRAMVDFLRAELQPGPGRFPFARIQDQLAIVALSTARPSLPLMAVGTLGGRQIRLAEVLLGSEACRERFRLVVLHHAPKGEHVTWHSRLTDAQALIEMLRRAGADLVAHGHTHRFSQTTLPGPDGPIPLIGVGSSTWLSPKDPSRRAQYNLYQIEGRSMAGVSRRRYDPRSGLFEPYSKRSDNASPGKL